MNQNNNDYIYPFDYFNRRQHKDIEGKIVYVTRLEEGKTQVLFDPFLIIAKHEGQIIAVRLRAKVKSKNIAWNENQKFAIAPSYSIVEKELHHEIFQNKLETTDFVFDIDLAGEKYAFNIDLEKWYVLKPIISKDHKIYEDKFISQNIYNAIMSRYISFNPSGMLAEIYNMENWEAGN
jgi:hypothetical protein